jgi:hypothetical protein
MLSRHRDFGSRGSRGDLEYAQRICAEFKQVILNPNPGELQDFGGDRRQGLFGGRTGRDEIRVFHHNSDWQGLQPVDVDLSVPGTI